MASRDRFEIKLKCPECGKEGTAKAEEADGIRYSKGDKTTFIKALPTGFKEVARPSKMGSVDIECEEHRVSAIV